MKPIIITPKADLITILPINQTFSKNIKVAEFESTIVRIKSNETDL
jgi:hypothetical protein